MSNPDIPDELLAKIAKKVAKKCWWELRPLLRAGKRGRDIVYRPDVLKVANIYSLCSDPDEIHVAGRDPVDINREGRHRPLFKRCLDAGNPTAIYYEGLRLVTQECDIKGAITLLNRNVPIHGDATLAAGVLCICDGNGYMGGIYLDLFAKNHHPLQSDETRFMCEELIRELSNYGPSHNNTYGLTFDFPDCTAIKILTCVLDCYIANGPFQNIGNDCYLWRCARKISQML